MTNISSENPDTLVHQIILEFMREKKRKRISRWIKFLLIITLIIIAYFKFAANPAKNNTNNSPHVGLINVNGEIFDNKLANADYFAKGMDAAYKSSNLKALIIRINSPGGSPVQADYMYQVIQSYRKAHPEIKVYAVCVDLCASAAYYIAAAADEIYANESSMVGSIGVLYNGFGFVDTLQKLGISRRLQTAGKNKGFLDPFSPIDPKQQTILQGMLDEVHAQFIRRVKEGRGDRLKIDDDTFSGLFWTGIQAKERGLIDAFGSSGQIAKQLLKIDTMVDYTYEESVFERFSKNIGTALAGELPLALGLKPQIR